MFYTLRWVFKYCYCDRLQWGITYSGVFLLSFLAFFVHFLQSYHIVSFILVCPLGFRTFYGSQFPSCSFSLVPSCSFSLASPFVPVGHFDSFLFFSFLYYSILMFFSLIFVQDCCCMAVTYEGFCRMRTDGTCCMIFSSFKDTVHMYWYWFQDDRHCGLALSPLSFPVTVSLWLGA